MVEQETLTIYWVPPSYWTYRKAHWSKQRAWQEAALVMIQKAVAAAKLERVPLPCLIYADIYKRHVRAKEDCINYVTPIDKCILDNLTAPSGNKTRGIGLIPDDCQGYVRGIIPYLRLLRRGEQARTVLRFVKVNEPAEQA